MIKKGQKVWMQGGGRGPIEYMAATDEYDTNGGKHVIVTTTDPDDNPTWSVEVSRLSVTKPERNVVMIRCWSNTLENIKADLQRYDAEIIK